MKIDSLRLSLVNVEEFIKLIAEIILQNKYFCPLNVKFDTVSLFINKF